MPPKSASRGEYIETDTGNKISRRALLHGTPHIVLAGKSVIQHDVVIRGDLVRQSSSSSSSTTPPASSSSSTTTTTTTTMTEQEKATTKPTQSISIHLGRYVFVSPHCTLHPPSRLSSSSSSSSSSPSSQTLTYFPLRIADFVSIGPHTHVNCASIGSHVEIGARCVVGNMVIVKDKVRVLDDTVLPAGSVWASGSVVGGRPARVVGEVGEAWGDADGGGGGKARELWAGVGNAGGRK